MGGYRPTAPQALARPFGIEQFTRSARAEARAVSAALLGMAGGRFVVCLIPAPTAFYPVWFCLFVELIAAGLLVGVGWAQLRIPEPTLDIDPRCSMCTKHGASQAERRPAHPPIAQLTQAGTATHSDVGPVQVNSATQRATGAASGADGKQDLRPQTRISRNV